MTASQSQVILDSLFFLELLANQKAPVAAWTKLILYFNSVN